MTRYNVKYKAVCSGDDFEKEMVIDVELPGLDTSKLPPKTDLKKIVTEHEDAVLAIIRAAVISNLPANHGLLSIESFYE